MISISYVHLCIPAYAAKPPQKTLNLGLPQQMCKYESFQCMRHIYWDKSMISKYKKTSCVIHKIQHLYVFAFLPILPASPLIFPSQRQKAFQANTHKNHQQQQQQ